ncbi:hypothetical protein BWK59_12835 [Flavobacterium davisii]|uniref:DUF4276 family protein n=1 Tax=Flavobacterium davisii TaxID=2906077 RepID=A0A246GFT8_9FLAO|nr:hypothetical protein [Flavobacterium davisii]OWP83002.1 hypothetical protein BWK59_12835 [Flavobacterium davisii]
MNLYFILEGEKTEVILYPKWISHLRPDLKQVDFERDVVENNYYIFSGGGIPSIYNHTVNAIKNINDNPVFDKLIVCLDGEEIGVNARIAEIKEYIQKSGVILNDKCEIEYVIQNVCIESWFLGNRKIVKRIPENIKLREFIQYYNVVENDPELMDKMEGFRNKAHFHFAYFREILKEHNLTYSKSRPKVVLEESFLNELKNRTEQTNHLPTLKSLFDLLSGL